MSALKTYYFNMQKISFRINHHPKPIPESFLLKLHARLFLVKLPELLNVCTMAENKLKVLHRHLESFIDFLNHHKEWYGDKFYVEQV
ncbi:hypothetical protein FQR65_LT03376 [Abscondita terminalis]|nr:hypothetical protein FQR65_LT03376 [Abscondita terminalis]